MASSSTLADGHMKERNGTSTAHLTDDDLSSNWSSFAENASSVVTLVMITLCICGVIGNSLSLAIYIRPSFRRRSINILLAALSASDVCLCLLAIPVFSTTQLERFLPGISKCLAGNILVFAYPVAQMLQSTSVWLLVAITVDRYLAVCHPFRVLHLCTQTRALATVSVIVISSVFYNFVRFWEFTVRRDSDKLDASFEESIEMFLRGDHLFMLLYQNIATNLTLFFVPLLVHCVLNLQVARAILQASDQRRDLVASEKREFNIAKMMLFVVLVFICCYTFGMILNVAEILDEDLFHQEIGYLLNDISNTLIVINSSTSFIFYVKFSTRFRVELRNMRFIRLFAARYRCCFGSRHVRSSGAAARQKKAYSDLQKLTITATAKCSTLNDVFLAGALGTKLKYGASRSDDSQRRTTGSTSRSARRSGAMSSRSKTAYMSDSNNCSTVANDSVTLRSLLPSSSPAPSSSPSSISLTSQHSKTNAQYSAVPQRPPELL